MKNGGNMADVEFETLKADEVKFGRSNFLEVARKKAVSGEGSNEFLAISRGFYMPDGTKRFRRSLAVPDEPEIIDFVAKKLKEFSASKAGKKAKKEESPKEEPAEAEMEEAEEATE